MSNIKLLDTFIYRQIDISTTAIIFRYYRQRTQFIFTRNVPILNEMKSHKNITYFVRAVHFSSVLQ